MSYSVTWIHAVLFGKALQVRGSQVFILLSHSVHAVVVGQSGLQRLPHTRLNAAGYTKLLLDRP